MTLTACPVTYEMGITFEDILLAGETTS